MTFSDRKVAELVNAKFVAAWFNRSPGFGNADYQAEEQIYAHSAEAYTTKNVCTFVLAPDRRVFTYVAGYLAPALFIDFLESALAIRETAFDERMRLQDLGVDALIALHAKRAARFEASELKTSDVPAYRDARHTHTDRCTSVLRSAGEYFARLHKQWSRVPELPTLESIRYSYSYGNDFSEEGKDGSKIARDRTLPRRG